MSGPEITGSLPVADETLVPGSGNRAHTVAFDMYAAIIGTGKGELLSGSGDWDQIFGRAGADVLLGGARAQRTLSTRSARLSWVREAS